jgi:hypothetical protein
MFLNLFTVASDGSLPDGGASSSGFQRGSLKSLDGSGAMSKWHSSFQRLILRTEAFENRSSHSTFHQWSGSTPSIRSGSQPDRMTAVLRPSPCFVSGGGIEGTHPPSSSDGTQSAEISALTPIASVVAFFI